MDVCSALSTLESFVLIFSFSFPGLLSCLLLLPLASPQTTTPLPQQTPTSEGFFLSGSSYTLTSDTLSLSAGARIAFSFRTCSAGELLKQTAHSLDQFQLRVTPSGALLLSITTGEATLRQTVGSGLLDGQWHTASVSVSPGADEITLGVDSAKDTVAGQGELIRTANLTAPSLRVGAGMVACLREGPGVRFTKEGVAVNSFGVNWAGCFMPESCQGRTV